MIQTLKKFQQSRRKLEGFGSRRRNIGGNDLELSDSSERIEIPNLIMRLLSKGVIETGFIG